MNFSKHSIAPDVSGNESEADLIALTANIVSSYVHSNSVQAEDLPNLIDTVHGKLQLLSNAQNMNSADLRPAIPVEESITPDHIYCLEDGKPFKMLKKHLMSVYNLTPQEYRQKWNLAADYPMVAPNYAVKRQELAKKSGLGRKRTKQV